MREGFGSVIQMPIVVASHCCALCGGLVCCVLRAVQGYKLFAKRLLDDLLPAIVRVEFQTWKP